VYPGHGFEERGPVRTSVTKCAASGLSALYTFYAQKFPRDRGALLSYTQDSVLPSLFDISEETQFTAGLDAVLLTDFKPNANLRFFTDATQGHVLWFDPTLTSNGVSVEAFLSEMESGGTWSDAGPKP
jgi:hypothetical protein